MNRSKPSGVEGGVAINRLTASEDRQRKRAVASASLGSRNTAWGPLNTGKPNRQSIIGTSRRVAAWHQRTVFSARVGQKSIARTGGPPTGDPATRAAFRQPFRDPPFGRPCPV